MENALRSVFLTIVSLILLLSFNTRGETSWAWYLNRIGWPDVLADERWADTLTFGAGQGIAVFDTGIDDGHLLFSDRQSNGKNFAPDTPLLEPDWQDGQGHGTAVGSVAGGGEGVLEGGGTWISGISKNADVWSARVLDSDGFGGFAAINNALEWVISQVVDEGANIRVVNMSLGTDNTFIDPEELVGEVVDTFNSHAQTLRALNIPIVAASGNSAAQDGLSFPAIANDVVAVGSSDEGDEISFFTNRSEKLDVLAPGEAIFGAIARIEEGNPDNQVGSFTGTSMAAPLVAGSILLINEIYEQKWGEAPTYEQLFEFITYSNTIIDDPENENLAFPRLDLQAALDYAYRIPEPGSFLLLFMAALVMISCGRRTG